MWVQSFSRWIDPTYSELEHGLYIELSVPVDLNLIGLAGSQ